LKKSNLNLSDDGNDTTIYPVDNDNASTRLGFIVAVKASDETEVGSKIEVQFESDSSIGYNFGN